MSGSDWHSYETIVNKKRKKKTPGYNYAEAVL